MSEGRRSERIARLLEARIEELARALERAPAREATRGLEAVSVATTNAVTLELLTSERAAAVWRDAAERHPHVAPLHASPVCRRAA